MPWCYGNSGGYGRYMERRTQPIHGPDPEAARPKPKRPPNRSRPVECVEGGCVYPSAAAAARAISQTAGGSSIRSACAGKQQTAYGFHWRWADQSKGGKPDARE